jgi:protein TonB
LPGARTTLPTRTSNPDEVKQSKAASVLVKLREVIAAGTQTTDVMLGAIAVAAHSLTDASGAAIAMPQDGVVTCMGRSGETAPELGTQLDVEAGISGECLRTGMILCCGDAANELRLDPEACRRIGLKSIAVVPLRGQLGRVGVLEVFSSEAYAFDEDHMDLLGRLAGLAEAAWVREEAPEIFAQPPVSEPVLEERAPEDHSVEAGGEKERVVEAQLPEKDQRQRSVALARVGEVLSTDLQSELRAERRWRYASVSVLSVVLMLLLGFFVWRAWYKASLESAPVRAAKIPRGIPQERAESATRVGSGGKLNPGHPVPRPASQAPVAVAVTPSVVLATPDVVVRRWPAAKRAPAKGKASLETPPASAAGIEEAPQLAGAGAGQSDLGNAVSTGPAMPRLAPPIAQGLAGGILLQRVQPIYPQEARAQRLEGTVVLDFTITQRGQVEDVEVVSGPSLLAQAASNAVVKWRYMPYVLDGRPIRKPARISITFKLAQ